MLNNKIESAQAIIDIIYPVGSIYMSVNSVSPQILFGGSWEQIEDTFLLAAGSTYTAGNTGGSATHTPAGTLSGGAVGNHTLTVAEMPSHGHPVYVWDNAGTMANAYYYNGATQTTHSGARLYTGASSNWIAPGSTANAAGSGRGDPSGGAGLIGGNAAHNHSFTQPTFTGIAQDTMPPYLTVYIWKRVS